jgi:hypothetical protein
VVRTASTRQRPEGGRVQQQVLSLVDEQDLLGGRPRGGRGPDQGQRGYGGRPKVHGFPVGLAGPEGQYGRRPRGQGRARAVAEARRCRPALRALRAFCGRGVVLERARTHDEARRRSGPSVEAAVRISSESASVLERRPPRRFAPTRARRGLGEAIRPTR